MPATTHLRSRPAAVLAAALAAASVCASAAQAQNRIANPGFELGNTGFTSDYAFSDGGNCCEGQYTVRSNGSSFNGFFTDPPPAVPGSVLMMVANGSTAPNVRVWRQTVSVLPGVRYRLNLLGCTAVAGGPAILQWQIEGGLVGQPTTLPGETRRWVPVSAEWTAPPNSVLIDLAVRNLNTATFPNDFYIDELSMIRACLTDITGIGGPPTLPDGLLTGDDFNAFIAAFASNSTLADIVAIGGVQPPDGRITGDDFVAFIAAFAQGCP